MRSVALLRSVVPALLLFPAVPVSAAAGLAHGEFSYSDYWLYGYEERFCAELGVAGACSYEEFVVHGYGSTCVRAFPATLRLTSGLAGPVEAHGTLYVRLGRGTFVGRATTPGYTVVVEASYSGQICHPPTLIPVDTHVDGTYKLVSLA